MDERRDTQAGARRLRGALFAVALMLLPAVARAGERPRISVAPVAGETAPAELRERFGQSLTEGLLAAGADIAAAPAEAPYVLRATLDIEGRSYALKLEMVDRKSGVVVASREDRCEICTESEAFETANTAASTLKALVFRRGPARSPNDPAATGHGPSLAARSTDGAAHPGVTAPGASVQIDGTAEKPEPAPHRALGWTGVVAGVLSGGAGAVLLSIDGKGTCDKAGGFECRDLYDTRWGGIGLVSLGVVLVGAGILAIAGRL